MAGSAVRRGLILACAFAAAVPAAAPAATVNSGRLAASVEPATFGLEFTDRNSGPVLTQHPGVEPGPTGTLGFRTAHGWYHASRVISGQRIGRRYRATLATTDPLGRTIELAIEPAGEGAIRVRASVAGPALGAVLGTGIGFEARVRDRYLGFGERSNAVDQRGGVVESFVADGPYQDVEYPFISAFVPPAGFRARDDATYFPMPWLLSSGGWGVLLENTERSRFRLGSEDPGAWSAEVDAPAITLQVLAGPHPAGALRRLTRFTGRQPPPAAPWFFAPWYQPTEGDFPQAQELRRADVPASVANTYTHYLPCGSQQGAEARQRERTRGFHAAGYAVTTYFNPMVCTNYTAAFGEAASAGLLTENALGQPYLYRYGADIDDLFVVGQVDFSAAGADAYYGGLLDEAVAHGYDGWMEDFGEYTPLDSVSANGMTGSEMHNLYPVLYHRSSWRYARTAPRPVAGFIRSGYTGVHPYAQLVWGGDPTTSWGFDGLRSALWQGLTMGMSGISRWGSDIGGFFALGFNSLDRELLIRWIELGAVSGIMRTQANGVDMPPKERPQVTDDDVLPHWRRYTELRTQLYPYIRALDAAYRRTGVPAMRHMALEFPGDRRAVELDDQFMFGPALLAAPVLDPGLTRRGVYLPRGRWIDFWRAFSFRSGDGAFELDGLAAGRPGGRRVSMKAPLGRLPLMVRAGSVLAMLPADVDTLASYGADTKGVVRLADVRDRLRIAAFPRGRSGGRFGETGRFESIELEGDWHLGIDGPAGVRYALSASLGSLRNPIDPAGVAIDGTVVPERRWRYDERSKVLEVVVPPSADGTMVVSVLGG